MEKELNVGDKLVPNYNQYNSIIQITRVTKTMAMGKRVGGSSYEYKFKRTYKIDYIREIGSNRWSNTYYTLLTPELEAKIERWKRVNKVVNFFNKFAFEHMTDEQLTTLEQFIKP